MISWRLASAVRTTEDPSSLSINKKLAGWASRGIATDSPNMLQVYTSCFLSHWNWNNVWSDAAGKEFPKELFWCVCVFPLKLRFVTNHCRQEGWHVQYRNVLHCQNPSEVSKLNSLGCKRRITKKVQWSKIKTLQLTRSEFWGIGIFFKANRLSRFQHFFLTQTKRWHSCLFSVKHALAGGLD